MAGVRINSDVPYTPAAFPAPVEAAIYYQSQPGDPIRNGASGVLGREGGAIFNIGGDANSVYFARRATGDVADNYVSFGGVRTSPAQYGPLVPGLYDSAQKFGGTGTAALEAYLFGYSCADGFGSFVVYEYERSATAVTKFAADFEFHCEGVDSALYGGVRYNSTLPYTQAVPPAQFTPAAIYISSEASDRILHGARATLRNDQGQLGRLIKANKGATFQYGGAMRAPEWELGIIPRYPGPLTVGTYESGSTADDLFIAHRSSVCSSRSGRAVVYEVEMSGAVLRKLAADIDQQCDGAHAYAGIRYNKARSRTSIPWRRHHPWT